MKQRAIAFTLVELLVVVTIIAILVSIAVPVFQRTRLSAWRAVSAHTLSQLGAGGAAYRADHDMQFWPYRHTETDGVTWWFGFESFKSLRTAEGQRVLDLSRGPLGPYVIASGGVKSDPAFMSFSARFKPKYSNGTYGYGYNTLLGGGALGAGTLARATQFDHPDNIVVFATCAQVNTFQAPATAKNPMLEEFFLLDDTQTTVHFRFGRNALVCMLDGSVRELPMDITTRDPRMPSANIGRFAPVGSKLYLWE
jgi:prepilin-type N-terminal cleavage/methylation domain-containing protein